MFAGLVAYVADAGTTPSVLIGVAVALATVVLLVVASVRVITRARGSLVTRFPR